MKWMLTKFIIGLVIVCTVLSVSTARDKEKIAYHLERGSRIWINGSATLGSYECKTVAVFGTGNIASDTLANGYGSVVSNSDDKPKVAVQVKLFDCGNPAMNEDMYEALKADQDSLISYELTDVVMVADSMSLKDRIELKTIGNLTIAGKTRRDTIVTYISQLPGRKFSITGEKKLSMLDFGIVPPSAFFGLIKANENLVVNFDLVAAPQYKDQARKDKFVSESK